jgi:hypothetical protein
MMTNKLSSEDLFWVDETPFLLIQDNLGELSASKVNKTTGAVSNYRISLGTLRIEDAEEREKLRELLRPHTL